MTVGETPGVTPEDAILYAGDDGNELNMVFQSELMDIDAGAGGKWEAREWKLAEFKKIVSKWQTALGGKAWNSIFLGNHDQPRAVSRFGNAAAHHAESAKMLATLLMTHQGTPYIFQGDEIGMTNASFQSISDCRDIETLQYYKRSMDNNVDEAEIMRNICRQSRDNARTPLQWSNSENAGFSQGIPWMGVNPNFTQINVEDELHKDGSILRYYSKLIRLRHENDVLIYGKYRPVCEDSEEVMAYIRELDSDRMLVVLSFSEHSVRFEFPKDSLSANSELLTGNLRSRIPLTEKSIELQPYEALVIRL
jgi:oligo-1,6-glucosidase